MLRRFGRIIWTQSRDIRVVNYPEVMVYEIFTNKGYLYIAHDKTTNKIESVNVDGYENAHLEKLQSDARKEILAPRLE